MISFLLHLLTLVNPSYTSLSEAVNGGIGSIQPKNHYLNHGDLQPIPPASPDCWLSAFKSLDADGIHFTPDGTVDATVCSWMAPDHQKVLALELSRCHLKDLGRSLMTDDTMTCSDVNIVNCLTKLSDIGVTTYTSFFAYVNQLCLRLLQEVVVNHYHSTSFRLAKSSELAEGRLQEMIEMMDQSDVVMNRVLEVQNNLRENEEKWILRQEQERKEQAHALERQLQELQAWSEETRKNITELAMAPWYHGLQSAALTGYSWCHSASDYTVAGYAWFRHGLKSAAVTGYTRLQSTLHYSAATYARFRHSLQSAANAVYTKMHAMSDLPAAAYDWSLRCFRSSAVATYTWLHSAFDYALAGFAWFQLAIFFLSVTLLVMLLTSPRSCRWMRFYMMGCLLVETKLEIYFQGAVENSIWRMPFASRDIECSLKKVLLLIECLFYVAGLFASLLVRRRPITEGRSESHHYDAFSNPRDSALEASNNTRRGAERQSEDSIPMTHTSHHRQNVTLQDSDRQSQFQTFEVSASLLVPKGVPGVDLYQHHASAFSPISPQHADHTQNSVAQPQPWISPATRFPAHQQPMAAPIDNAAVAAAIANTCSVSPTGSGDETTESAIIANGSGDGIASRTSPANIDDTLTMEDTSDNEGASMASDTGCKRPLDDLSAVEDEELHPKRPRVSRNASPATAQNWNIRDAQGLSILVDAINANEEDPSTLPWTEAMDVESESPDESGDEHVE